MHTGQVLEEKSMKIGLPLVRIVPGAVVGAVAEAGWGDVFEGVVSSANSTPAPTAASTNAMMVFRFMSSISPGG